VRLILDGSGLKTDILLLGSEDRGEWRAYPWWDENFQWQCVSHVGVLLLAWFDLIWYDTGGACLLPNAVLITLSTS
jgi:hypothetical protein